MSTNSTTFRVSCTKCRQLPGLASSPWMWCLGCMVVTIRRVSRIVPMVVGVIPMVLGVVPRVLGVVPQVLGVVPRVLEVAPRAPRVVSRVLGAVPSLSPMQVFRGVQGCLRTTLIKSFGSLRSNVQHCRAIAPPASGGRGEGRQLHLPIRLSGQLSFSCHARHYICAHSEGFRRFQPRLWGWDIGVPKAKRQCQKCADSQRTKLLSILGQMIRYCTQTHPKNLSETAQTGQVTLCRI